MNETITSVGFIFLICKMKIILFDTRVLNREVDDEYEFPVTVLDKSQMLQKQLSYPCPLMFMDTRSFLFKYFLLKILYIFGVLWPQSTTGFL